MAVICRHYRISPLHYRDLTLAELGALIEYMDQEIAARKRANSKAASRRGG